MTLAAGRVYNPPWNSQGGQVTDFRPPSGHSEITRWLDRLKEGDAEALDRVVPLLYAELRGLARSRMRAERPDHTLSTTALVHEVYLRLLNEQVLKISDRGQFLAVAATVMRRLLVDWARAKQRKKRGGGLRPLPLEDVEPWLTTEEADETVALDEALQRLNELEPRAAAVVELRFFGGLTMDEIGNHLGVSTKTAQRDWVAARAWLRKEVGGGGGS